MHLKSIYKPCQYLLLAAIFWGLSVPLLIASTTPKPTEQKKPLTEIIEEFSERYKVFFSYDSKTVSEVESDFEFMANESLNHAMDRLLKPLGFRYESYGGKFFLIVKNTKKGTRKSNKLRRHLQKIQKLDGSGNVSIQRLRSKPLENIKGVVNYLKKMKVEIPISGTVVSEAGEPLIGVNILVKGTSTGTTTDLEGKYQLDVPEDATTLIFSYIGYKDVEISINGQSVIDVTMLSDEEQLQEVVVIGYGATVSKKDMTGALASADLDRAAEFPNVSIVQAVQGTVAGLNVGPTTNAGQNPTISIRGQSTLSSSAGANAPLIVLDGIIYRGSIVDLNSSDIESIDILKDVSSAAIYGSQASNGVIVITTKSGKSSGKPIINYAASYSIQTPSNKFEPMDAEEYETFYPNIYWADGYRLAPDFIQVDPAYVWQNNFKTLEIAKGYQDGIDIPWYDLFTDNGHVNSHNLSIRGQNEAISYFFSGGFTDQAAYILNDEFKKYNLRINLDAKINNWLNLGTQTYFAVSDYSGRTAGAAIPFYLQPWAPPRDEEGEIIPRPEGGWFNPYLALEVDDSDIRLNMASNLYLDVKLPLEGLSYRLNYANNFRTIDQKSFDPIAANFTGVGSQRNSKTRDWTLDNIITYKRTFNDVHNVNATLVYGVEERDINSIFAGARNFAVDFLGYHRLQAGDPSLNQISSSKEKENSLYQMARLLYNFNYKYYVTGTIRRDGFSGFGLADKTAIFPSVALGWVISEEAFASDIPWLNFLKLRASYGQSGRRGVGRYATAAVVESGPSVVFGDGGQTFQGQSIQSLSNPALGWETTTGLNLGVDFELEPARLRGNIEYYTNKTEDILFAIALPRITGFSTINDNIAEVSNNGIELTLSSTVLSKGPIRWDVSFNFNRVRNKIESILGADVDQDGKEDDLVGNRLFIGQPQRVLYDYEIIGMWQLADENDGSIWNGFFPGTYKLADLNGDGKISSLDDRKILGYLDPSYRFGISNTVSYRNLSLYVFINSIQGGKDYYMGNDAPHNGVWAKRDNLNYSNVPKGGWDYWLPENPNAKYRRLDTGSQFEGTPYGQRSFVRLQDVSLSYNFPNAITQKIKINNLKVFVSGKNLLTLTDWKGQDPETGVGFGPGSPLLRSFTMGLNLEF